MAAARTDADRRLSVWANALDAAALEGEIVWESASAGRRLAGPRGLLVVHMFNHQTHHRGQVHAMLTAAGEQPGATDIPILVEGIRRL